MEITLRAPRTPDPRFNEVVQFIQMCLQRDPRANEFTVPTGQLCMDLREQYPDDPAMWQISSLVANFIQNHESAKYFLAKAILLGIDDPNTRDGFNALIENDPCWNNVDSYFDKASSVDRLAEHYLTEAHQHFANGELETADMYCQRISALSKPIMTQFHGVHALTENAKIHQLNGTLNAQYTETVESLAMYWEHFPSEEIDEQLALQAKMPDRHQFADITATAIRKHLNGGCTVFEIGCFAGYNLNAARERLTQEERAQIRFIGMEPNTDVVKHAQTLFPDIEFLVGDHDVLIAGTIGAPDPISVCTISRVLMVILPAEVERLLTYLAPRVKTLVICDDIFNIDGELSVPRTPANVYLVHNFRPLLENAGFEIQDVIMADVPDRECTGFIIAKGQG